MHTSFECSLTDAYKKYRIQLCGFIRRRFPGFGPGRVEDIVSATFEAVMQHPERLDAAWQQGGTARSYGLLKVIAWRQARNLYRRASFRRELLTDETTGLEPGANNGLDVWVHVHRSLPKAIEQASSTVCPRRVEALQQALEDKIASGDTDTAVAQRHQLPREYVNRAKNLLIDTLFGD